MTRYLHFAFLLGFVLPAAVLSSPSEGGLQARDAKFAPRARLASLARRADEPDDFSDSDEVYSSSEEDNDDDLRECLDDIFLKDTASKTLKNRYELQKIIATGNFGGIYQAKDKQKNKDVAVKVMLKDGASGDLCGLTSGSAGKETSMFKKLKQMSGYEKYVVEYFDSFDIKDYTYIVMELCSEGTLESHFKAIYKKYEEDQEDDDDAMEDMQESVKASIKKYFPTLASGVEFLHGKGRSGDKIFHRDLNMRNILGTKDSSGNVVFKIADFGCATTKDEESKPAGDMDFFPPEMFASEDMIKKLDLRKRAVTKFYPQSQDIYALGMLLVRSVTMGDEDYDSLILASAWDDDGCKPCGPNRLKSVANTYSVSDVTDILDFSDDTVNEVVGYLIDTDRTKRDISKFKSNFDKLEL